MIQSLDTTCIHTHTHTYLSVYTHTHIYAYMLVVAICVLKEQTLKTEVNYNICLSVPFKAAVINLALLDQVMYNVTSLAHKNK